MSRLAKSSGLFLLLALAACASAPEQQPVAPVNPAAPVGIDPLTGQKIDLTPGLNDREPDTCKAADYAYLRGQNQSAVATAGITKPTRLIPLGSIVSQEEYNSFRINFHLDGMGNIVALSCG